MISFEKVHFIIILKSYLNEKNKSDLLSGIQFYQSLIHLKKKLKSPNYVRDSIWVDVYNSSFLKSTIRDLKFIINQN